MERRTPRGVYTPEARGLGGFHVEFSEILLFWCDFAGLVGAPLGLFPMVFNECASKFQLEYLFIFVFTLSVSVSFFLVALPSFFPILVPPVLDKNAQTMA